MFSDFFLGGAEGWMFSDFVGIDGICFVVEKFNESFGSIVKATESGDVIKFELFEEQEKIHKSKNNIKILI